MKLKAASNLDLLKLTSILSVALAVAGCNGAAPGTNNTLTGNKGAVSPSPVQVSNSADVVKVRTTSVTIAAGGEANATITLSITSGYHVNANPATFPYLIPTELTANSTEEISVREPIYPTAHKKKFQFADEPLAVYEGETQVSLPLRAKANAAKVSTALPIRVRVQACDDEKCYAPATLNETVAIDVK